MVVKLYHPCTELSRFSLLLINSFIGRPSSHAYLYTLLLFKKGHRFQPANYRPISLLSIFDKLIEKLMYNRLISYLNENNVFTLPRLHLLMLLTIFMNTLTITRPLWEFILTFTKLSTELTMTLCSINFSPMVFVV